MEWEDAEDPSIISTYSHAVCGQDEDQRIAFYRYYFLPCLYTGAGAFSSKYHYDLMGDALNDEGLGYGYPQYEFIIANNVLVDMIGSANKEGTAGGAVDYLLVPDVFSNSNSKKNNLR